MHSCCELNEDEELRLGFSDEWTPSADSAVARPLRNPRTARTSAPRLQELPADGPEPLGEKEALSRGEIRSAWSWLKKVILEENVKGVDIRLHSWREEERERDRESATLFRLEQMEWLDTGGKAIGYSFFSFPFFLHAFMTLEDLKSAIKSLICPGTWSGDPRKGVQYEEKKQMLSLKAYFHNNTHEQADFFSAEPQLLECHCSGRTKGFAVVHMLYSVIAVPPPPPRPCLSPFDREDRKGECFE